MIRTFLGAAIFAIAFAIPASAADIGDLSNDDILRSADAKRGALHGVTFNLDVQEENVDDQSELFVRVRNENFLAEYTAPAGEKGKRILERNKDMWFIQPNASHAVPISPRQKLLGAASYADIAGQRWASDYEVTSRQEYYDQGQPMVRMMLKAADDDATYDRIELDLRQSDVAVTRSVMKSADGTVLKTAVYEYDNKVPSRYQDASEAGDAGEFISKVTITPKAKGENETTMMYKDVAFEEISSQVFLLRNAISD